LLSEWYKSAFILINHVILSSLFCLFGIGGNVINICVFVKQGLSKSMNANFFAMAVSDILETVAQLWQNVCLNPYLLRTDSIIDFDDIQYLTAGWPSLVLVRITGWITVYVTAERCLSVTFPLNIKQIVTPRRTAAILVFIYVTNIAGVIPLYFSAYFSWNFYPAQNRTKLGISFRRNKHDVESLIFSIQASLTIIAFCSVVVLTSFLIVQLNLKSKWRRTSTLEVGKSHGISSRERKAVAMVIVVASVLLICYTPAVVCSLATAITHDFSITGEQVNVFHAVWSFAFLFHSMNSSVAVILYYKMSSKYRETFRDIFPRWGKIGFR
ncbi:unnamed protein product, partial [Lymnaea stagnalis]